MLDMSMLRSKRVASKVGGDDVTDKNNPTPSDPTPNAGGRSAGGNGANGGSGPERKQAKPVNLATPPPATNSSYQHHLASAAAAASRNSKINQFISNSAFTTQQSAPAAAAAATAAAASPGPGMISVTVAPFTGGPFTVTISRQESVEELKKAVAKKLKVLKDRICLLYRER